MRITKKIAGALAAGLLGLTLVSGFIVYGGEIDTRAHTDTVIRGGQVLAEGEIEPNSPGRGGQG